MINVIHGEYVNLEVQLYLRPANWMFCFVDLLEDVTKLGNDNFKAHVNACVDRFIIFAQHNQFVMNCLKESGACVPNYAGNLSTKLKQFFNRNGIVIKNAIPFSSWPLRGLFWIGIHSEICVAGNITQISNLNTALHHYILYDCCYPMHIENSNYLINFSKINWNNTTALHTNLVTFVNIG
jgi:hypothetical protein